MCVVASLPSGRIESRLLFDDDYDLCIIGMLMMMMMMVKLPTMVLLCGGSSVILPLTSRPSNNDGASLTARRENGF